jgi:DNA-binding NtrC family response regulator
MLPLREILRVVVVDDEKIIADSLALICESKGHAARTAYSGEEAIELCHSFRPHAVISDVKMGGMSGVDLAIYLAEAQPECRVLLVSGHDSALAYAEESAQRGHFHTILPKPFHPSEVLNFLQTCDEARRAAGLLY